MQRCHLLVVEGCGELLLRDVLQLLLDPLGRVLPGPLGVVALGMGLPLVRVAVGLVLVGPLTPAALRKTVQSRTSSTAHQKMQIKSILLNKGDVRSKDRRYNGSKDFYQDQASGGFRKKENLTAACMQLYLVGLEVEVPVHVTLERVLVLESFPTDLALEPLLVAMGAVGVTHQVLAVVEELAADGTGQLGRPVDPVRHIVTRDSKVNAVKSVME